MKFFSLAQQLIVEATYVDVYRIEHKKSGLGPYRAGYKEGEEFAKRFPISVKYNPAPLNDHSLVVAAKIAGVDLQSAIKNGIFAFSDLKQMRRWFTADGIDFLINTGVFHIVKKQVPPESAICGITQCVVDGAAWNKAPSKSVAQTVR